MSFIAACTELWKNIVERAINPKDQIIVARIIEGDQIFIDIKKLFEERYPQFEIIYVPELGAHNENSTKRFERLILSNADVFLGGNIFIHERYRDKLGVLRREVNANSRRITSFDSTGDKWLCFYNKLLGFCWNQDDFHSGFKMKSFHQLDSLEDREIQIPTPNTSAGIDFLQALSVDGDSLNLRKGEKKYLEYLKYFKTVEYNSIESCNIVARSKKLSGAVTWPHDALRIKQDQEYDCIGISVFNESVLSASGVSISKAAEGKPGIEEFVDFVLSDTIQKLHFQYNNLLPSSIKLFSDYYSELHRKLTYCPPTLPKTFICNDDSLEEIINELENAYSERISFTEQEIQELNKRKCRR